jgi:(2Fe-2S) ferredoxin
MQKPQRHIFVCASFRATGAPQGLCHKKDALPLIQYLEGELSDRDMDDTMVTMTGCLKVCEKGPVMVVYPEKYWYGEMNEQKIDEVLDALEDGKAVEDYLIA